MSSRILPPDDPRTAGPVLWRHIGEASQAGNRQIEPDLPTQIAEIQRQCEQRVQAAHAAGHVEGEGTGRKRAAAEVQPVLDRLAHSIEELAGMRARLRRQAEDDIVRLALAIARRVLHREMSVDPGAMRGVVLSALEKLQVQEISRVRVHPSHAAQLTSWLRQSTVAAVEVIADSSQEPGGLVFETEHGDLDASVNSQLQEIERGLTDRLRRNR